MDRKQIEQYQNDNKAFNFWMSCIQIGSFVDERHIKDQFNLKTDFAKSPIDYDAHNRKLLNMIFADGMSLIEYAIKCKKITITYDLLLAAVKLKIPFSKAQITRIRFLLKDIVAVGEINAQDGVTLDKIYQLMFNLIVRNCSIEEIVRNYALQLNHVRKENNNYAIRGLLNRFFSNLLDLFGGVMNEEKVIKCLTLSLQVNKALDKKIIIEYYLIKFILNSTLDNKIALTGILIKNTALNQEYLNRIIAEVKEMYLKAASYLSDFDNIINLRVLHINCLIKNFLFAEAATIINALKSQVDIRRFSPRFVEEYNLACKKAPEVKGLLLFQDDCDSLNRAITMYHIPAAVSFSCDAGAAAETSSGVVLSDDRSKAIYDDVDGCDSLDEESSAPLTL